MDTTKNRFYVQPNPNDILGDSWSGQTQRIWDKMKSADSELASKPHAWSLWQWAQCVLAGRESNIVASPQCIAIAANYHGEEGPDLDLLDPLLDLSDRVIRAEMGEERVDASTPIGHR